MCGILGITERNGELVREAAKTFAYRGPDASRVSEDERVTLGHNRLSIIDLDERANQPMTDAEGMLRIVFNGEIYNYKDIRRELEAKGYSFRTSSDTEVLLYAYKEWKGKMVERLRGMYAFAIHDRVENKLVLVTDHAGMKPIFYARVGSSFAFASELKGIVHILRAKKEPLSIDETSLGLYYALGYVPVPKTIYKNIFRMPRRAILTFDIKSGGLSEAPYEVSAAGARSEEELKECLERSVERHLVADVPVGLFFSGGTDSSLIASILAKRGVSLQAFSLEIDKRPEDKGYFDAIASHLKLSMRSSFFGPKEFDEVYGSVVSRLDEPIYDSSLFPTYYIAREAAKHVKVVLSGDGGDEYFLGYPRSLVLSRMHDAKLDAGMTVLDTLYVASPRFRGKAQLFAFLFTFFRQPVSYYLLTMSPAKDFLDEGQWRAAKEALAARRSEPTALDADYYLENDLLRKLDLATMYNSLEGRIPLLDADVISCARMMMKERVPLAEKKPLLKKILAAYLPGKYVYRGKRGFGLDAPVYFPTSKFLKDDLAAAIRYLEEKNALPPKRLMPLETIIARRPQMAWQLLMLYHALKNSGV